MSCPVDAPVESLRHLKAGLVQDIPGTDLLAEDYLLRSAQQFFRGSARWITSVTLEPAQSIQVAIAGREIVKPLKVAHNGQWLVERTRIDEFETDHYYSVVNADTIQFSFTPTGTVEALVAVAPATGTPEIEKSLLDQYQEAIRTGARYMLFQIPGKNWTDQRRAQAEEVKFNNYISSAWADAHRFLGQCRPYYGDQQQHRRKSGCYDDYGQEGTPNSWGRDPLLTTLASDLEELRGLYNAQQAQIAENREARSGQDVKITTLTRHVDRFVVLHNALLARVERLEQTVAPEYRVIRSSTVMDIGRKHLSLSPDSTNTATIDGVTYAYGLAHVLPDEMPDGSEIANGTEIRHAVKGSPVLFTGSVNGSRAGYVQSGTGSEITFVRDAIGGTWLSTNEQTQGSASIELSETDLQGQPVEPGKAIAYDSDGNIYLPVDGLWDRLLKKNHSRSTAAGAAPPDVPGDLPALTGADGEEGDTHERVYDNAVVFYAVNGGAWVETNRAILRDTVNIRTATYTQDQTISLSEIGIVRVTLDTDSGVSGTENTGEDDQFEFTRFVIPDGQVDGETIEGAIDGARAALLAGSLPVNTYIRNRFFRLVWSEVTGEWDVFVDEASEAVAANADYVPLGIGPSTLNPDEDYLITTTGATAQVADPDDAGVQLTVARATIDDGAFYGQKFLIVLVGDPYLQLFGNVERQSDYVILNSGNESKNEFTWTSVPDGGGGQVDTWLITESTKVDRF